jgi:two-component system response regulator AtoC
MATILIVDDEPSILESLDMFLAERGHDILQAQSGSRGLELCRQHEPEVAVLDIRLPDISGLDVLRRMQREGYPTKVIMITAFQDMETTIEAMKCGAYDYIHKPLDIDEVERAVERALQVLQVDREPGEFRETEDPGRHDVIIGKSESMREIFKMIGLLCQNRATVLIQGETGTGKELVARVIHRNSLYHQEPFITLDCSSVVETLLESELFGHEKGAFTGATRAKPGLIELAGRGTLFLDEIGELPLTLQRKFLGFLQRREYMRIGGSQALQSSCRIIAASNKDLNALVQSGHFKEDLYYRLRVVALTVPPLRERLSDIPALVDYFLRKINRELDTGASKLQSGVLRRLEEHPWTGNVRELENVLVEALIRAPGNVVLLEEIENILRSQGYGAAAGSGATALPSVEREHIRDILERVEWNRTRAARLLGISLPTLRSKIHKYGLAPEQGRH